MCAQAMGPGHGHLRRVMTILPVKLEQRRARCAAAGGWHSGAVAYADRWRRPGHLPSLVLGSGEVTLMSMATAFAAFANGGLVPAPLLISRVEDANGQVLFTSKADSRRAISGHTAFLVSNMLADVINSGTAWSARREGFTLPAAGKTGTTNEYRDPGF